METSERRFVLEELASSEARLLDLVEGLTPDQWNFRETPDRWSIAEIIEHLILFENFILGTIAKVLEGPAEPGKKALAAGKEPLVLGLANTRGSRIQAREAARPVGSWPDAAGRMAELRKARARTVTFAAGTEADLRGHFFPHLAFGDLDCYQWLLVLSRHVGRHALQIEEIKAHPAYPIRAAGSILGRPGTCPTGFAE
jgi:hypothetical protein